MSDLIVRDVQLESQEHTMIDPKTILTGRPHEVDLVQENYDSEDDNVFSAFTPVRKLVIVAIVSLAGFNAAMDTMAVSAVIPEIAAEFNTTGSVINISNAIYVLFMAASPVFWGPLSQVYGRRWMGITSTTLFASFSLGTALSPTLVAYFIFRSMAAFETTAFFVLGSSCIGDIYRPQERSTALGWFLFGTVVGPAIGPFVGGMIVAFQTWRVLFWLQTALGTLSAILVFFFLPETIHHKLKHEMTGKTNAQKCRQLWTWLNPARVLGLVRYPNLLIAYVSSAALIWNQQCLLTPVRYVINPRFQLTSPLLSGLFFLAPGVGYLVGTILGGRWADATMIEAINQRGRRVPEDRLRSTLLSILLVIPSSILVYGWSIEKEVGGIPLPVIAMFLQGVGQMVCFPSLNAYCLDTIPQNSAEVISGAYFFRYAIAAVGTAAVLPAIQSIGTGWFSTLTAGFVLLSGIAIGVLVKQSPA